MLNKQFTNHYEMVFDDMMQKRSVSVSKSHRRKFTGQAHIMEYVILALFIMMLLVLLVLFLSGWQITTTRSQQRDVLDQKTLFLLRAFSASPLLNKEGENFMLEDSKLMALTCKDLEEIYGYDWFAEVRSLSLTEECNDLNYPICGYWSFCKKDKESRSYEIPVNIYKKTTKEVDIAILTVGVYE